MPRFIVDIPEDYRPEDGDAFDALFESVQLSEIPATVYRYGDEPDEPESPLDPRSTDELVALCEANGVRIVEAQEEEIRGMWDWLDDHGNACDCSFDTQREAALDAIGALDIRPDDGTNGQDRESYTDTQDRDSYST